MSKSSKIATASDWAGTTADLVESTPDWAGEAANFTGDPADSAGVIPNFAGATDADVGRGANFAGAGQKFAGMTAGNVAMTGDEKKLPIRTPELLFVEVMFRAVCVNETEQRDGTTR